MWDSRRTANRLPKKRKTSENPALAQLALHTALEATPYSISIPVAAEYLRTNGVIVMGDIPSSLTISYGNNSIPLRIENVEGNNATLVNDHVLPDYDANIKKISIGFVEGLQLDLKVEDILCGACAGGSLMYEEQLGKHVDDMGKEIDITDTGSEDYPYYGLILDAEEVWNNFTIRVSITIDLTQDESKIRERYFDDDVDDDESFTDWIAEEPLRGRLNKVEVTVRPSG